jgi:hypothetical protein
MKSEELRIKSEEFEMNDLAIENRIYTIRGIQVMVDSDLAALYGTETKFLSRAVKRNPARFPDSFVFQLSKKEWENLKFQFGTSSAHGGDTIPKILPFAVDPVTQVKEQRP